MLVSIQLPPAKVKCEFKTGMSSFKPGKVDIAKGDLASNSLRLSQSVHLQSIWQILPWYLVQS